VTAMSIAPRFGKCNDGNSYGKVGNTPYRYPPNSILGEGKGGQIKGGLLTLHWLREGTNIYR